MNIVLRTDETKRRRNGLRRSKKAAGQPGIGLTRGTIFF